MLLTINRQAAELGIAAPAAAIIDGIVPNAGTPTAIIDRAERALANARENLDAILAAPKVVGYREVLRAMGHGDVVPAGERLVVGFLRSGFKSYGALIDAYNVVALERVAGIGLHDAGGLGGELIVDRSDGTQAIVPMFKSKPQQIAAGDLYYSSAGESLAWLGRRDVDSEHHKVGEGTTSAIVVVLGNSATSADDNRAAIHHIYDLVRSFSVNARLRELDHA